MVITGTISNPDTPSQARILTEPQSDKKIVLKSLKESFKTGEKPSTEEEGKFPFYYIFFYFFKKILIFFIYYFLFTIFYLYFLLFSYNYFNLLIYFDIFYFELP